MTHERFNRRGGFTAVEMLFVIGIVSILTTMALPAIVPALRKGRVNDAASAIVQISQQARMMAVRNAPQADNKHYGVAIFDDGGPAQVALIYGSPTDGCANDHDRVMKNSLGKPVAQQKLPPSVTVWSGSQPLASGTKSLTWYYDNQSGTPVQIIGTSFSTTPVSVGCPGVALTRVWGIVGNDVTVPSVSPGAPGIPGLSVRSADGKARRAIAIYSAGIPVTGEF